MTKVAAVWARVSDAKQEEPSLDRQAATVKTWLEEQGWEVPDEKVIKVVWTSKKILNCPQMQMLVKWVKTGEVKAVGMTHLDRLSGRPGHMSQIFEVLKDANCQLLAKDTPLPTGLMGELVALVLTLGKAMQVDKADNGAKDGLRDRVKRKRLPTSKHRLYGYHWVTESQLAPDPEHPEHYEALKVMFDLAVRGATYFDIQKELRRRVVPSPSGNPEWDRSSIACIVNNPVYAGRYYALKHEACEPKMRKVAKEGNTSNRPIPLEQATYLPEVEVIDPPITWEQYLQLQEQHRRNQELAKRNAHHDYLLRGFIVCETHYGKKGEPRKYYGQPQNKTYGYTCPIGGCAYPNLNGPETEDWAKLSTWCLMNLQPDEFYERIANRHNNGYTEESLNKEFRDLEIKYSKNINAEIELERRSLLGQEHPEVYRRLKAQFQAQRTWIKERKESISEELAQLDYHVAAIAMLQEIRSRVSGRLMHELSQDEWRELFTALNLEIHVRDRNNPATWPETESENSEELPEMDIRWGLPLKAEAVSDIVFKSPCPSPSS